MSMTAEQVKSRLQRTRNRIHQELADLADDIGNEFVVELSVDWLHVGTMDDPYRQLPRVEVAARIVP